MFLFVCVGLTALAGPWDAPLGRSGALLVLPVGATRLEVGFGALEPNVRVSRRVARRVDVAVSARPSDLFDLGAKLVVVEDLVPILVAVTVGTDGVGIAATLFLGPVQIDGGKAWGEMPSRWGRVEFSIRPTVSLILGVDVTEGPIDPYGGIRLFSGGHRMWEIGLAVRRSGIRWSLGDTLW